MTVSDYAVVRASDHDRQLTQSHLNDAFADGLLSQSQLDERTAALAKAITCGYLAKLTEDLPLEYRGLTFRPDPSVQDQLTQLRQQLAMQRTNGLAIAALVCGLGQLVVGFPAGIAAIIVGRRARRQIRQSGEQGDGMARAGVILGYLGVGLTLCILLLLLVLGSSSARTLP